MPKLPILSGREAIRVFEKLGWHVDHQTGSHVILQRSDYPTLSIPDHRELAPGLLRGLIRRAGLTVEEFLGI
ncbi:MAG: type II toxin-antitoxin system HicA family toxin [Fimbriimonadaceae bacterium]|nr:type II toxin-antitoxin system HicA family toxin [Fimbriimonadaceae bacterium]